MPTRSPEEIQHSIERTRRELATLGRGAAHQGQGAHRLAPPDQRAPHRRDRRRSRARLRGGRRLRRFPPPPLGLEQVVGGMPPTPSRPGPTCVPSTGPTSETNSGGRPMICSTSWIRCPASSGAWMCCTTHASAPSLCSCCAYSTIRFSAFAPGAHALDRSDLLFEREDRLDLERRAEPRRGSADPPPAAQVLERVDGEPHLQRSRVVADALHDFLGDAPPIAARAAAIVTGPCRRRRSRSRPR